MALAFAKVPDSENVIGKMRTVVFDVTLDTSYSTGGMAITAANVGLRRIIGARFWGGNAAQAKLNYVWDTTNLKILAFFPTGGATAAPTSLADPVSTTGASTASAVNATTPAVTPGQAKEVGATADLSSIVVRMEFLGG